MKYENLVCEIVELELDIVTASFGNDGDGSGDDGLPIVSV